jgi:hypothetical protein
MKSFAAFAIVLLFGSVALAEPLASPDTPQSLAALWPMLAVGGSNLAGIVLLRASDQFSWLHSKTGKAAITVVGTFLSSIPSAIQGHGLCWAMLAWAALGAITTLTTAMSTSAKEAQS